MDPALPPDCNTHRPGHPGLHADALRHVLQHLDLPGCRHGLRLGILCGFSSPESHLRRKELIQPENVNLKTLRTQELQERFSIFAMPGLRVHDIEI